MGLHQEKAIRLNIGCGKQLIEGWINIDLIESADLVADVKNIPLPDNYADEAMAIHVLEHCYRWEAPDVLKEWKRLLKPGALMAVEVPDIVKCCKAVIRNAPPRMGLWGLYGDPNYKEPLMIHRWAWSGEELAMEMKKAGFSRVRICQPKFHKPSRDVRVEGFA